MLCKQCGTENRNEAKFCANCGQRLLQEEIKPQKACWNCARENPPGSRFCAECGAELRQHHPEPAHERHHQGHKPPNKKEKRTDTRPKWHPALVGILVIAGVVVYLAVPYMTKSPPRSKPAPPVEQRTTDPKIEGVVREIASRFICSCGSCGEQPLDTCTCARAVEERQFIRESLHTGQNGEQIIAELVKTYGGLKFEFTAGYGSETTNNVRSAKLKPPSQTENLLAPALPKKSNLNVIAKVSDRVEIFSHFSCACGQCGIDELKDCNCNHPKGAQEVKSFVDGKIAEGKYTVAQLVGEVERKYGGRKF